MSTLDQAQKQLLLTQLAELYFCENQLLHGLDGMAKASRGIELKELFIAHRGETEAQIARLEAMFAKLGEKPHVYPCNGMEGLLEDGLRTIRNFKDAPTLDTALIGVARKVEMLEVASYRNIISLARQLGQEEVALLCEASLMEEEGADEKLWQVAEGKGHGKKADPAVSVRPA